jgi:ferritin-like metal-binding protein YciE
MPAETTLHDLFLDTLKDICRAEQQVLKALPKTVRGPFQSQAAF